jgi:hypothetical protein
MIPRDASPTQRAELLLRLTETLTTLAAADTARIAARAPPPAAEIMAQQAQLANAYRLEIARIQQEPALIESAPAALRHGLAAATQAMHAALDAHQAALAAVKEISEGLARAIAEEVAKQRAGPATYVAGGGYSSTPAGPAIAMDRRA